MNTVNMLGLRRELISTFDETLSSVTEALKSEGFGVLTEIDVRDTLKKKLGVDFRRRNDGRPLPRAFDESCTTHSEGTVVCRSAEAKNVGGGTTTRRSEESPGKSARVAPRPSEGSS